LVEIALDCGYLNEQETQSLLMECQEIGRLLGGVIAKAGSFCNPEALREPLPEYFIGPDPN
jgi:hypothetical protein